MKRSRKLARKLAARITDWDSLTKYGGSQVKKHPTGYTKPGSNH